MTRDDHALPIKGAPSCRRLQKLWLFSNQLTRVESLSACADLRELWVQDNQIETLESDGSGLVDLVNLQTLHLAKNRVRNIDDFQHLRKLINLRVLTLTDAHFGSNPVAAHPDYRACAVTTFRQLTRLDGKVVENAERVAAEDRFMTQCLAFNDKIAELTLAYENELRMINARKERGVSNAQMLQQELVEALNELEHCVSEGRQSIEHERQRQQQVREQNTALLQESVRKLQDKYQRIVDRQMEEEELAMRADDIYFDVCEQQAQAERAQCFTMATLQYAFPGRIAFQQLTEHSPDYRFIASHFEEPKQSNGNNAVKLLQAFHMHHHDLQKHFESAVSSSDMSKDKRDKQSSEVLLFYAATEDDMMSILQSGMGALATTDAGMSTDDHSSISNWVLIYSNPLDAIEQSDKFPTHEPSTTRPASHLSARRVECTQLLICRAYMENVVDVSLPMDSESPLPSAADVVRTCYQQLKSGRSTDILFHASLPHGGDVYALPRAAQWTSQVIWQRMLPQFVLLCAQRVDPEDLAFEKAHRHEEGDLYDSGERKWSTTMQVLRQFEQQLDDELTAFYTRLYHELDPETVQSMSVLQHQCTKAQESIRAAETRVKDTRRAQDQQLRALRQSVARQTQDDRRK